MTTKEFIQYANDRPELCEKMAVCTTPEEVYAIATAEGLTDSIEDFKEIMIAVKNALEITDDDLENVSAGRHTTTLTNAAIAGVVFASANYTAISVTIGCFAAV